VLAIAVCANARRSIDALSLAAGSPLLRFFSPTKTQVEVEMHTSQQGWVLVSDVPF